MQAFNLPDHVDPNIRHINHQRDSDNEDLDEFEENSSGGEEDMSVSMNNVNDNMNANNNVFSTILNNLSQASSGSGGSSRVSSRSAAANTSSNAANPQVSSSSTITDPVAISHSADVKIFAKYAEKAELSESANSLIQRKRELILNSKK